MQRSEESVIDLSLEGHECSIHDTHSTVLGT